MRARNLIVFSGVRSSWLMVEMNSSVFAATVELAQRTSVTHRFDSTACERSRTGAGRNLPHAGGVQEYS